MIYNNISELYEQYDSFFIDMYGVLYNGCDIFDGALLLLEKIKNSHKKVVILSNSTLIAEEAMQKFASKGLLTDIHYDEFVTSGEVFRLCYKDYINDAETFFLAFNRNTKLFDSLDLKETNSIEAADFVYVGSVNNQARSYTVDNLKTKSGFPISLDNMLEVDYHDIATFETISEILDECLKYNKPLMVVDPDIFVIESVISHNQRTLRPVLCQGGVGEFYERAGGKVLYFGKPYPPIYDFAKKSIPDAKKTAMIGDTSWIDVLGGNRAQVDTILVLTGVSGELLPIMSNEEDPQIQLSGLINEISKKLTHKSFSSYSQIPTYIAQSFA
jgi:HAD superfamily hydrolase (TIGR01450 family)